MFTVPPPAVLLTVLLLLQEQWTDKYYTKIISLFFYFIKKDSIIPPFPCRDTLSLVFSNWVAGIKEEHEGRRRTKSRIKRGTED